MYLTFDVKTRELISFSDTYYGERNVNFSDFIYIDKFVVVKSDEIIDFIETQYDEDLHYDVIVPGQYALSDVEVEILLAAYERNEMFKKAKKFTDDLIRHDNLGYYLAVGKIGSNSFIRSLLERTADHFNINPSVVKDILRRRYEKLMEKLLFIDMSYENFTRVNHDRTDSFDWALEKFKTDVSDFIKTLE